MASIQFPASPTNPETVIRNGVAYTWNGSFWEANTQSSDFDERYVEKVGDNMTGDLTLGTDKITLDAGNGSITAAGKVIIGPNTTGSIGNNQDGIHLNDYGFGLFVHNDTNNGAFITCSQTGQTSDLFSVSGDGSGTFASTVQVKKSNKLFTEIKDESASAERPLKLTVAYDSTVADFQNTYAIQAYDYGTGRDAFSVLADGTALFAGVVKIGGLSSAPNIELKADGNIIAANKIEVGDNPLNANVKGCHMQSVGQISVRNVTTNLTFASYDETSTQPVTFIRANGDASFGNGNIYLSYTGSGTFAGAVVVGPTPAVDTIYSYIDIGFIGVRNSGTNPVYQGFSDTSGGSPTSSINADGSATFSNRLSMGNTNAATNANGIDLGVMDGGCFLKIFHTSTEAHPFIQCFKSDGANSWDINVDIKDNGNATFAGTVTANGTILTRAGGTTLDVGQRLDAVAAFKESLKTSITAATDLASVKTAILDALEELTPNYVGAITLG